MKTCICGKTLPYLTDEDILFYNKYHSLCTDSEDAWETVML